MISPQRPNDTPDLVVVVSPPVGRGGRATPRRITARGDTGDCVVSTLVGRDPTCGVCVDDPAVSRAHARVEVRRAAHAGVYEITVTDQGGPGGTRAGEQALAPLRSTVVADGAALDVAGWTVTLRLDAARGFTSDSQVGDAPAPVPAPMPPPMPLTGQNALSPPRPRISAAPSVEPDIVAWALRVLPFIGLATAAYALWVTFA
jgi:hypothetical protein